MMAELDVAFFVALRETSPLQLRLSWDEFVERLSKHREQPIKDGPGFSAVLYRDGYTRGNDGIESLSAAVVDVDHEEPLWHLLEGLEYVAFTSYSHGGAEKCEGREACPHWRVVLPFVEPVPRDQWTDVRARVKFWLVPNADDGAKDAARFNYMPACKVGAPRETRRGLGDFLNPNTLAPVPVQAQAAPSARTNGHAKPPGTEERPGDRLNRIADWGDILGPHGWRYAGERGDTTYWIRPNKRDAGHSATSGGGGYNVLYVFSSNAAPFDPFTSYTKFEAYALLNHNGDRAEATRDLSKKFGMESVKAVGKRVRPRAANGVEGEPADDDTEDERPQIHAGEGDLLNVRPLLWDALASINVPPFTFTRAGSLIRLDLEPGERPRVVEMTVDRLAHTLVNAAHFYSWKVAKDDEGKKTFVKKEVPPPLSFARDMLAEPSMPVPVLDRVVQAPVFGADGICRTEPGYHDSSKTYYAPPNGLMVPDVPFEPTAADVDRAKALILTELLGDFPFVEQPDQAHAVAMGLLPYARDLIDGATPAHSLEAPTPGSGKTLLSHALLSPSCGTALATITPTKDDEEWRKVLTTHLRQGCAAILIDNVNRTLDSASLSSALTSELWEGRILGRTESVYVPIRCVWAFTGNNPTLSTEIARRTIRIRIDPGMDRPFLRENFRHADLNTWVKEHRGDLIWANLVLIRSWINTGKPSFSGRVLGSYEHWSQVIGGILEHVGIAGFLGNLFEFYETADLEGMVWRGFVERWWEAHRSAEVTASNLFPLAQETEGLDLGTGGERSQKIVFGKALGSQRDRVIGGFRVVNSRIVHSANLWRLLAAEKGRVGSIGECSLSAPTGKKTDSKNIPLETSGETLPNPTNPPTSKCEENQWIEELPF